MRNRPPPRTTTGLKASGYCRVLGGGIFYERGTHVLGGVPGKEDTIHMSAASSQ